MQTQVHLCQTSTAMGIPIARSGLVGLLIISGGLAAITLLPNWELVSLVNKEGMDALGGQPHSGRVFIGLMSALFFALNLVGLLFQTITGRRGEDYY